MDNFLSFSQDVQFHNWVITYTSFLTIPDDIFSTGNSVSDVFCPHLEIFDPIVQPNVAIGGLSS